MKDFTERTFTASLETIEEIVGFVDQHASEQGVHPKRSLHLQLAVEEAVANICSYAYEVPPGEVSVTVARDGSGVRVVISDNGVPFDPLSKEDPDIRAELEARSVGGLGVFLIRRVLDEVHYNRVDGKNVLTLRVNDAGV
jgi:anti-sigma regulatory factor (Ser/Thr protein kinase)